MPSAIRIPLCRETNLPTVSGEEDTDSLGEGGILLPTIRFTKDLATL